MQAKNLSLVHLVQEPQVHNDPPPLLLLLHGIGSNEYDLFGLVPYLDKRFLVISARAPITLMPGSYAWFEIDFRPEGNIINIEQALQAHELLMDFLPQAIEAYGAHPQCIYLMGFSQGALMSANLALTQPSLVAGTVLMSGRIPSETLARLAPHEELAGLPVMVTHGIYDDVLPIHDGRHSRDALSSLPVRLTYREYLMGHQVSDESISDVSTWLSAQLDMHL